MGHCILKGVLISIAADFEEVIDALGLGDGASGRVDGDKEGGGSIGPGFLEAASDVVGSIWEGRYNFCSMAPSTRTL